MPKQISLEIKLKTETVEGQNYIVSNPKILYGKAHTKAPTIKRFILFLPRNFCSYFREISIKEQKISLRKYSNIKKIDNKPLYFFVFPKNH
jgi:hypothetical protein